ncbi:retrovirus-related pol polyprotein from transposon TNT 1-94 [Tanacetum coccineum]|uniref:Retrovirus-related pol polyprotein from transposon TNT 1-94 n=1 Tax=Tanacetum coccineum TaxID=301880 RepID=A0ABQ5HRD6_9ASTR
MSVSTYHTAAYNNPQQQSSLSQYRDTYPNQQCSIDYQPQQTKFPTLDYGLAVPVFDKGDDPIDVINKTISQRFRMEELLFSRCKEDETRLQLVRLEQSLQFCSSMANLLIYGADASIEVNNPDNVDNNMINQVVQFFYDRTTKQALGFQNPFYLKKAQQLEPKLYKGNVIKSTSAIVIPDRRVPYGFAERESVVQIVLWYLDFGCSKHMTRDRSQLTNFVNKFSGTVKFGNDHVAKILGYGDYQIGNVTISRVYYVEGLGHNLFSVRRFCDSNIEVAFRQHTCFIRNLKGVDLLTGSRGKNLYTLSLGDMMASSLILVPNPPTSTPFVPPLRNDWDLLFQPLFDKLLNPPSSVDRPTPKVIALIAKVVTPVTCINGSPSSTTEDNHDLDVAHMNNDLFFGIPIPKNDSKASSSSDVIPTVVHTATPNLEHVTKLTKDHPLDNIIGELERPEELNEFERLEVWELVPHPYKVMVITLKWIYKVKLNEFGGILKNKSLTWLLSGYRQDRGIDFGESFAQWLRLDAYSNFPSYDPLT